MKTIYTIGHSTKPLSEFLSKLKENNIKVLVDVRSIPRSRFQPQYNEKALRESMVKEGIEYRWRGKNLGGRGENIDYEDTIDEIAIVAEHGGERMCLMCSEGDYKKCHRHEMLEPSFVQRGFKVEHITYEFRN
ncbi:MAG TPA: DUF488 domain-containing protein [Candidatus Paceibacterota bacterium]|nr:DUF488 domain-containing protein [Candidatus Paceibacterota bacterium]